MEDGGPIIVAQSAVEIGFLDSRVGGGPQSKSGGRAAHAGKERIEAGAGIVVDAISVSERRLQREPLLPFAADPDVNVPCTVVEMLGATSWGAFTFAEKAPPTISRIPPTKGFQVFSIIHLLKLILQA